ncbi:MAG: site-specific integrase [Proteobacteria bacterium]|nr:site-specific integrase [Pseudomonadota bacterium]
MNSVFPVPQPRRLTRGTVELRARTWWNRYRAEYVDPATGTIARRQTSMRLGRFRSATEAAAELDRYLALLSADALQPGVAVTAREYFARFDRLRIALMRRQTQRSYRGAIVNHLEPAFGKLLLSAIDATAAQELVASLHRRGLARGTIETIRNRLLEVLGHARAAGFAAHHIRRRDVPLPSQQRAERTRRHITAAELTRILEASTGDRRVLWAILGFTGVRIGEALGLTWEHVDFAARVLRVRQAAAGAEIWALKTTTSRGDIPLLPELERILREHKAHTGVPDGARWLLFRSRTGRPLRADDVRRRWLTPLLARLGLPPAGCHAFRHGLPGRLDALGLSPAAIQKFMRHSTLAMTERYLHRSTSDLREQLDAALRRHAEGAGA